MKEVKRLSLDMQYPFQYMEDENGNLVYYKDYAELKAQRDALAAENAALKQVFVTREFSTEVTDVFSDTAVLKIDGDEHYCHQWVDNDSDVIRAVLTAINAENPTPATDAYLNAVRAEGVDYVAEVIGAKCAELKFGSKDWKALKSVVFTLTSFAAQLRSGNAGKDGSHE